MKMNRILELAGVIQEERALLENSNVTIGKGSLHDRLFVLAGVETPIITNNSVPKSRNLLNEDLDVSQVKPYVWSLLQELDYIGDNSFLEKLKSAQQYNDLKKNVLYYPTQILQELFNTSLNPSTSPALHGSVPHLLIESDEHTSLAQSFIDKGMTEQEAENLSKVFFVKWFQKDSGAISKLEEKWGKTLINVSKYGEPPTEEEVFSKWVKMDVGLLNTYYRGQNAIGNLSGFPSINTWLKEMKPLFSATEEKAISFRQDHPEIFQTKNKVTEQLVKDLISFTKDLDTYQVGTKRALTQENKVIDYSNEADLKEALRLGANKEDLQYKSKSYYWLKTEGAACSTDISVGCGQNAHGDVMYHLKVANKKALVTLSVVNNKMVNYYVEAKGGLGEAREQNITPDEKFWPCIEHLLLHEKIYGERVELGHLQGQQDFLPKHIKDPLLKSKFEEFKDYTKKKLPDMDMQLKAEQDPDKIMELIENGATIPDNRLLEIAKLHFDLILPKLSLYRKAKLLEQALLDVGEDEEIEL